MEITTLRGPFLSKEGLREMEMTIENGIIVDLAEGVTAGDVDGMLHEGLIIPSLLDMHTHMGDCFARGDLPPGLLETVLPGGVKHRFLEGSDRGDLVESIRFSLRELAPGVGLVLDYREGGLDGLEILREAIPEGSPMILPLGRVTEGEDPVEVLSRSVGFGIPSLDGENLEELRELAGDSIFSVHASELYREDIDRVLSLKPDQVVHMVSGTVDDWTALAEEKVPVTVCPRSNMAYGIPLPLGSMMKQDLSLTIGTDNSISSRQDIFREMEVSWLLLRRMGLSGEETAMMVFDMASGRTLDGTELMDKIPLSDCREPRRGDPASYSILRIGDRRLLENGPYSFLVRFATQHDVLFSGSYKPGPFGSI